MAYRKKELRSVAARTYWGGALRQGASSSSPASTPDVLVKYQSGAEVRLTIAAAATASARQGAQILDAERNLIPEMRVVICKALIVSATNSVTRNKMSFPMGKSVGVIDVGENHDSVILSAEDARSTGIAPLVYRGFCLPLDFCPDRDINEHCLNCRNNFNSAK